MTVRKVHEHSILLEATSSAHRVPDEIAKQARYQALISVLMAYEDALQLVVQQRWPGAVPKQYALVARPNGGFGGGGCQDEDSVSAVALDECYRCLARGERSIAVSSRRHVPLWRLIHTKIAYSTDVLQQLASLYTQP